MDFMELNRKLEKFENRFELCLRAAKLARKLSKESPYDDEDKKDHTIRILEKVVADLDKESEPSDQE